MTRPRRTAGPDVVRLRALGWQAFEDGQAREACPFPGRDGDAWREGWHDAAAYDRRARHPPVAAALEYAGPR